MMKKISFAALFKPVLIRCLIGSVLEGGRKSAKNGLAMGVTIGGDAEKSGRNTNLLIMMHTRLSEKISLHNLTNQDQLKKGNG